MPTKSPISVVDLALNIISRVTRTIAQFVDEHLNHGELKEPHDTNVSANAGNYGSENQTDIPKTISVSELNQFSSVVNEYKTSNQEYGRRDKWRFRLEVIGFFLVVLGAILAGINIWILRRGLTVTEKAADAASTSANIAADTLRESQRTWLKISHTIAQPLRFNVTAYAGPVAQSVIYDTIENVGTSVALDVVSWEDIIPLDPDEGTHAAERRLNEWCDANGRPARATGLAIFPKDRLVNQSTIGPTMQAVNEAATHSTIRPGMVGFAFVGCVAYRSPVDGPDTQLHQTRFIYMLGAQLPNGAFQPHVPPAGVASGLALNIIRTTAD